MPTTNYKSPFATSFKSCLKRGTSYNTAVCNIAKRCNKSTDVVWASLFKAGLCYRQKFNGQWVYFPCDVTKCPVSTTKVSQFNCWQWFCEWCLCNGLCTPEQLNNHCGSQKDFMNWCKKFWGKQFTTNTTTTKKSTSRSYSFPSGRKRTYRKAA